MSVPPAQPDERHAVGNHQRSLIEDFAKAWILPGFGHAVHTRDRHIFAVLAIVNPLFDSRHGFRQLNRVNSYANDPERRRNRVHLTSAGFKHRWPPFPRKWSLVECRRSPLCSELRTPGEPPGPSLQFRMGGRKPS